MRINEVILNERPFTNKLGSVKRLQSIIPNVTTNPVTAQKVVFKGPKAKTWDQDAADQAAELENSGANAKEIWKRTGTFRNPDGLWRQEIADFNMEFIPGSLEFGKTKKMSDVIDHPELFAAYPNLKDMKFEIQTVDDMWKNDYAGLLNYRKNKITITMPDNVLDYLNKGKQHWLDIGGTEDSWNQQFKNLRLGQGITAHELDHAVQDIENPEYRDTYRKSWMRSDDASDTDIELAKQLKQKGFKDKYWDPNKGMAKTTYGIDSKEVQSRGAEVRAGMPPEVAARTVPTFGDTKVIKTRQGGKNAVDQKDLPGPTHAQTPGKSGTTHQIKNNPWYKKGNKVAY